MSIISKEDCIYEFQLLSSENPERVITRNFFRQNSDLRESDWQRHFGTFIEFKRAAGYEESKHERQIDSAVAKHASVETLKQFNKEKFGYEGSYLRPSTKRFQTIIHCTDVHDKNSDPFWVEVFLDTVARVQPEKIIIGGDLFDLPEFGKYAIDPREWDVVGRIKWVHEFLRDIRLNSPNSEMIIIEGNHEYRLMRHLAESSQSLKVVLSDLHGFTVPKLLGLDEYEINYVSRTDLAAFSQRDIKEELNRNYYVAYDCYLAHHFPVGEKMGLPGAHGHHHRHKVTQHYSPTYGAYEWHQLGAGHRRMASYCAGEQWGMGFMIAHIDTENKHVLQEYVQVRDFAMVGGKFYQR